MRRRFFLGAVFGSLGFSAGGNACAKPPDQRIELLRAPLAGYPYYQADQVLNRLRVGTRLVLRREPSNPYDRYAVEVFTTDGIKLGYIPRASVRSIARNMDRGIPVHAEICELRSHAETWRRIFIEYFV